MTAPGTGRDHFKAAAPLPAPPPYAPLYGPLSPCPGRSLTEVVAAVCARPLLVKASACGDAAAANPSLAAAAAQFEREVAA